MAIGHGLRLTVHHNFGRQSFKPALDASELAMHGVQVASPEGSDIDAADEAGEPIVDSAGETVDLATADFSDRSFDFV